MNGCAREQHEPRGCQQETRREGLADPEAHHELRRQPKGERAHDQIRGQEGKTDLERAVAEHQLQVERRQEEPREHRSRPQNADDVRGRDVAQAEEAEWHERRVDARLEHEERRQQRDRAPEQAERLRRGPAGLVPVDDRVDREDQRRGHRHRAANVETPRAGEASRRRQQSQREQDHGDADREVDQEDPVPVDRVGEDAAEQDADAAAACGHEAEDAHRLGPFRRLGEERHHQ